MHVSNLASDHFLMVQAAVLTAMAVCNRLLLMLCKTTFYTVPPKQQTA